MRSFTDDDIVRAEADDAKVEHNKAYARLVSTSDLVKQGQEKLAAVIREARTSTQSIEENDPLAQLVHNMKSSGSKL